MLVLRSSEDEDHRIILTEVKQRLRRSLNHLETLDIDSLLQAEILSELIDGPRSSAELVEKILYPSKDNSQEREACYARVRRAVKNLGAKGYVSTGLLRKNSPHRLTRYAVARLAEIGGGLTPEKLPGR